MSEFIWAAVLALLACAGAAVAVILHLDPQWSTVGVGTGVVLAVLSLRAG